MPPLEVADQREDHERNEQQRAETDRQPSSHVSQHGRGKRGRFNLGEKLFLSVCEYATVATTTGTIEFRESGWDVKRFFKLLVTSATYRQANEATAEKLDKDLENRLLSRGPRASCSRWRERRSRT